MTRSEEIRKISGLSRAAFSRKYNIPIRTLEDWDAGKSNAPEYVLDLLERAVLEDKEKEDFNDCWLGKVYIFPDGYWTVTDYSGNFLILEKRVSEPKKITIDELSKLFVDGTIKIK